MTSEATNLLRVWGPCENCGASNLPVDTESRDGNFCYYDVCCPECGHAFTVVETIDEADA